MLTHTHKLSDTNKKSPNFFPYSYFTKKPQKSILTQKPTMTFANRKNILMKLKNANKQKK